jgi:hypothetical protein
LSDNSIEPSFLTLLRLTFGLVPPTCLRDILRSVVSPQTNVVDGIALFEKILGGAAMIALLPSLARKSKE